MRTFTIPQGTTGLVLIQEPEVDVTIKNWQTRKMLYFTDENVMVDPIKLANFGNVVYEKGSHAARLAKDGYIVFSHTPSAESRFMVAVRYSDVRVN